MPKANVGHLRGILSLNQARFETGLKKAGKSTRRFSRRMNRSFVGLRTFRTLAAAAAATGIGALVKRNLDAIDSLAKTADKLGLSTEALAGLQVRAKLTGVEVRTLEMGLQRMVRRVSEASVGTGEARAALAELGLDARKLANLPVDQQFGAIADAMEQVTSQSDRIRLAFKLFDSEGVALVNTLRGGSRALDAARMDAERFGFAISRIDAARVESANDALTRLGLATQGVGRQIAIGLTPHIDELATQMTELSAQKDFAPSVRSGVDTLIERMGVLIDLGRFAHSIYAGLMSVVSEVAGLAIQGTGKVTGAIGRAFGVDEEGVVTPEIFGRALRDNAARLRESAKESFEFATGGRGSAFGEQVVRNARQRAVESVEAARTRTAEPTQPLAQRDTETHRLLRSIDFQIQRVADGISGFGGLA